MKIVQICDNLYFILMDTNERKVYMSVVKIKKNIKDAKLFTYDDISFVNKKSDDIQIRWNK